LLLTASVVLAVVFAASNVYVLPLMRDILREVSEKNLAHFSNHIGNAVLLFGVRLASKYAQFYVMSRVSYRMVIQLRMALYRKLQCHSMDFYSKWKMGDLTARVFSDVENVKLALLLNFESVLPNILTLVAVTGYLFVLNWKLAAVSLVGMPFFISIMVYFSTRLKRVTGQIQRKTADITHLLQENIANMRVVQAFTMEESEIRKFERQHERNFRASMQETKMKVTQEPVTAFLQFLLFLGIIWYGGYQVVIGEMTGGNLTAFFTGVIILVDPVLILSKVYTQTHQTMASAERIFEVLDTEVTIQNPKNPKQIPHVEGAVAFRNVSFSYDVGNQATLSDISIDVSPGETIALVGLSGSGKSTFVNLIPRFYDPQKGSVTVDGVNLRELDIKFLREQIAIVPQEPILFRGTILENIRYGRLDASKEEVVSASKKAHAWEFIELLTDGLLHKVGDQGRRLSGGQRQRISIARAILRDPKILILDEATSSLDSESEKLVQEGLESLMKNRTTFVIAHRLSTVMHADRILVIVKGKIAEIGKHAELLHKGGHYSRLFKLQFDKK